MHADLNLSFDELAIIAWNEATCDARTRPDRSVIAVKLLNEWTGLGAAAAITRIQKTADLAGVSVDVRRTHQENIARLAAHRAARGIRKIRGSKWPAGHQADR